MILGVVSLARAGKDTFADYLVNKYGYNKINTSDVLVSALQKLGKEPTKLNLSWLGDVWRKETGRMEIVTLRSLDLVSSSNTVITGLRSIEEIDLLRSKFPNAIIIGLLADKSLRYSRRSSSDPDDKLSFFSRDKNDIKNKGLAETILESDYFICNNSSLQDFHLAIDNLLRRLKNEEVQNRT